MTSLPARFIITAHALSLAAAVSLAGQPGATPRQNFWIPDQGISAVEPVESEDLLYIGGDFWWVGPPTGPAAIIGAASGVADLGAAKVVGNAVHAAAPDGEGGWYIGGDFQFVGGVERRGLARIRSDGSVDPDWNPDAPGVVDFAIAGGRMYLAGPGSVGGRPRQGLAAIDLATGVVLKDWIPIANGPITDIEIAGSALVVAGLFTELTFQPRPSLGAVDLNTGAVSPWNPSPGASPENPNGGARALKTANGRLYVSGQFSVISGQTRTRLAAFDASTLELLPWSPSIDDGSASDIEVVGDAVYLGGRIMSVGGQPRTHVAAVHAETGAVLPFAPLIAETEPWGGTTVEVNTIAYADGKLYVGGHYSRVNGEYAPHLCAIDAVTGAITAWPGHAAGPGPTQVYTLVANGSEIFAGGNFHIIGGEPRQGAAALKLSTGELAPWSPVVEGSVRDILAVGSRIYLGGQFPAVNGLPRVNVVAIDRDTGQTIPGFNANMTFSVFQAVNHLDIKDDTLYLGGRFFSVAGVQRQHIAAIDAITGALRVDWTGAVGAVNVIHDMTLSHDKSVLYVGGLFGGVFQIGGPEFTRPKIAAFDADSGQVTPFRAETRLGDVNTILPLDDGTVWVGGTFRAFEPFKNGVLFHRRGLAQLDEVTGFPSNWSTWLDGAGVPSGVSELTKRGSAIYFTGSFTDLQPGWAGGASPTSYHWRNRVAAMEADVPAMLDWAPQYSGPPSRLEFTDTALYASGGFLSYENQFFPFLTILDLTSLCPADIDGDGIVGSADLSLLLGAWGEGAGPADLDGDGAVGSGDLAILLGAWGACAPAP